MPKKTWKLGDYRMVVTFGPQYVLITNSQDVNALLADYAPNTQPYEYVTLFVLIDESGADVAELWGCSHTIPKDESEMELLYTNQIPLTGERNKNGRL